MLELATNATVNGSAAAGNSSSVWRTSYRTFGFSAPPSADEPFDTLHWITETFFMVPLICVGMVSNTFTFSVLCSRSCRRRQHLWHVHRAVTTMLQALVVADFATILSFVPQLKLLNDFKRLKPILLPTFRWAFTALCWFQTSSTWLTLLLTVNRYTAVWRPMTARWLFTIKRTHALIFTVVIGSLAISCPRFFEFELIANVDGTLLLNNTVTFRSHPIYSVAYRMVASLLIVYLIPISALAGLNLRMWLALRRTIGRLHQQQQQHGTCGGRGAAVKCVNNASCKCPRCMSRRCHDNVWHDDRRRRPVPLHQQRNEVQDNAKESENELRRRRDAALINRSPRRPTFGGGKAIFAVNVFVVISLLCNLSAMLTHILWSLEDVMTGDSQMTASTLRKQTSYISNVLTTFNSSVSCLVYCISSRNFRYVIPQMFSNCLFIFCLGRRLRRQQAAESRDPPAARPVNILAAGRNARRKGLPMRRMP